ncbi:MAG: Asp23/Gls24 family envelope stress response protein [Chloroflexi bacterium]|nr:Asp23/Gls24 family envelope stress response protein [Anaerolineae bacterium]RLC73715.1 MAG: Asp23/Gls24 family envelope stress response protein [Chloroflexota bacterium]
MEENLGKVIIAPGVLITIARLTTLSVPGVAHMAGGWGKVSRWLHRGTASGDGVQIRVEGNTVAVDLYIVVEQGANMLQVSRRIQTEVARAIENLVGMVVREVNIHIEDVEFLPGD